MKFLFEYLKDKSIVEKLIIIYVISIVFIGIVGYSYYIYGSIKTLKEDVSIYKNRLIESKKQLVKNMVNVAINGIDNFYKEAKDGDISEGDAKIKSIKLIYSMRYDVEKGQANYLWANTVDGIMITDPAKPSLDGKNVWDFKDKNGVYLFQRMAAVVKSQGSGFVHYCWNKLGSPKNECIAKISYVRLFYPWKWIIGSGFYLDSINKDVQNYVSRRKKDILKTVVLSFILGGTASLIAGIVFVVVISKMVSYLKQVGKLSEKLVGENIDEEITLPYHLNDELGYLINNFNRFIDENYKLSQFKRTIEDDVNIEAVYKRIEILMHDEFGFDEFSVFEVNNSKNALKQVVSFSDKIFCKQEILVDSSLCRAARTAKEINSFEEEGLCLSFAYKTEKKHVCIPLMIGGSVGSVVQIIFDKNVNYADIKGKIKEAKRFLTEASPVIEAKRLLDQLKESTLKDPLTGLYNRRFLDEFAPTFSASVKRRNSKAGILMCDIDFFKQVNDVYGHNIGDKVLKMVVGAIVKTIREADIAVRFGGEEFLIMLQDTDEKLTREIAERIRKNVEVSEIFTSGNSIKKTISIGYSIFPEDSENLWQCIKYSDVAMYKAKTTGRNRVVRFEKSMWESDEY